jgi:hypothetical protein
MTQTLNHLLTDAYDELEDIYTMSEEAVCFRYNVCTKQEIITMMLEEIEQLEYRLDEAEKQVMTTDPAFRNIKDYHAMRL